MTFWLALLAAAAQPAAVAAPSPPPAAAAEQRTVSIAVNPPLDRPILYRHSRRVVDRRGDVTVTTNIRVRFSARQGGGFRAEVTQLDASMTPADPAAAALFQRMFAMCNRPFVMLIDANGALAGVENEDAYWAESLRLAEQVLAGLPGTSAEQRTLMQRVLDMVRAMPRDQRLNMLTETIAPAFALAGASYRLGETVEQDIERTNLFGATMTEHSITQAERVDGNRLFLSVHAAIPPAALIAATERFYAMIPLNGRGNNTPAGRAEVLRQLRAADLTHQTDASYEVATESGLVQRFQWVETVRMLVPGGVPGRGDKTTTVLLERID